MTSMYRPDLLADLAHQKAAWSLVFGNWDLGHARSGLAKLVVPRLDDLYKAVASTLDALDAMAIAVTEIQGRRKEWAREYRVTQATAKIAEGERAANSFAAAVAGACGDIETHANRNLGLLARPAGADAAQEARLANLRSDVRMVLDATDVAALPNTFAELVEEALQDGDQLRAWLLTSSFARDYLRSRGSETATPAVTAAVSRIVEDRQTPEAAEAKKVLELINNGKHAVKLIHQVWFPHIIAGEVDELRDMITADLATGGARVSDPR